MLIDYPRVAPLLRKVMREANRNAQRITPIHRHRSRPAGRRQQFRKPSRIRTGPFFWGLSGLGGVVFQHYAL